MQYDDFIIKIRGNSKEGFEVFEARSQYEYNDYGGNSDVVFEEGKTSTFDAHKLLEQMNEIGTTLVSIIDTKSDDMSRARAFGNELYKELFKGDWIQKRFQDARNTLRRTGGRLRIQFHLPPELQRDDRFVLAGERLVAQCLHPNKQRVR